jgi:DNA-binding response OmpR family regulator
MGKRILFVDGDQTIAEVVNTMLEEMGHQVRIETSGMDALAVFFANPGGYDLIITDLGMPDISGYSSQRGFSGCVATSLFFFSPGQMARNFQGREKRAYAGLA